MSWARVHLLAYKKHFLYSKILVQLLPIKTHIPPRRYPRYRNKIVPKYPHELDLVIDNFGPVSSGHIVLKPLTVLMGTNNLGKSYVALLIHTIINTERSLVEWNTHYNVEHYFDNYMETFDKLLKKSNDSFFLPQKLVSAIVDNEFKNALINKFDSELKRIFTSNFDELARANNQQFTLTIKTKIINAKLRFSKNGIKIINMRFPKLRIQIICDDSTSIRSRSHELSRNVIQIRNYFSGEFVKPHRIILQILSGLTNYFGQNMTFNSIYLPAARTGILQAHKTIAASIVKNSPYGGVQDLNIPEISGVIADFLYNIIRMQGNPELEFAKKEIEYLERHVLHGKIKFVSKEEYALAEIRYQHKGLDISLNRVSSAISELSALVLHLKHMVQRGDMLIIEEPEAHLHPENQRLLAQFLVKLVRLKIPLVISTHSPYLIDEFNNFIQLGKLRSRTGAQKTSEVGDYLDSNEVAVYEFHKPVSGSKITKQRHKSKISSSQFADVSISQYNNLSKIQNQSGD